MKTEVSPSILTPQDVQVNDGDFLQGVEMILVKAEDQQISNDPLISQETQDMQTDHTACPGMYFVNKCGCFVCFCPLYLVFNHCFSHTVKKQIILQLEFLLVPQQWLSLLPSSVFSTL